MGSTARQHRTVSVVMATILAACAIAMVSAPWGGHAASASSAAPSSAGAIPILPGEPWLSYEWSKDCGDPAGCDVGIWLIRPDGMGRHMITKDLPGNQMFVDWSRDGERIVFITEWTSVWVANADGTDAEQVYSCEAPCVVVLHPAFSPDGTRITFEREDILDGVLSDGPIVVLDLADGSVQTVLSPEVPGRQFLEYPRWSPDGRSLVVEIERIGGDAPPDGPNPPTTGSVIAVADISGALPASLTILTPWEMFAAYPDWHPTDDRIVFSTYDLSVFQTTTDPVNLYTIRADGTELTQVTDFSDHDVRATQPSWTPDGERIIFTHVSVAPPGSPFGEYGVRETAFIDSDGTGLAVIDEPGRTHPRLRPTP